MRKVETVELKRAARRDGGDRYESPDDAHFIPSKFVIYIPQYISRPEGRPLDRVKITFED